MVPRGLRRAPLLRDTLVSRTADDISSSLGYQEKPYSTQKYQHSLNQILNHENHQALTERTKMYKKIQFRGRYQKYLVFVVRYLIPAKYQRPGSLVFCYGTEHFHTKKQTKMSAIWWNCWLESDSFLIRPIIKQKYSNRSVHNILLIVKPPYATPKPPCKTPKL